MKERGTKPQIGLALALAVGVIAAAGGARTGRRVAPEQFLISFWCGPPPQETTLARYQEIAGAGFNVAMPPCGEAPIAPALNRRILELCAQTGLKAVVSDPRLAAEAPSPGSRGRGAALDAVVADYGKSPALLGYFLQDEPAAGQFAGLAAAARGLKERDPKRVAYVNLFPNYASAAQLGVSSYSAYARQFLDTVRPRFFSFDYYALLQQGERAGYFENLEVIRRESLRAGAPFAAVVLSTPHGPSRDPSEADLRWEVYTALAYGARGIVYLTYWTPHDETWHFHDGILDEQGRRTVHSDEVRRINAELNALGPTLAQLRSEGVYQAGGLPVGTEPLPAGGPVREVRGGDAVIGLFRGPQHVRIGVGMFALPEEPEPEYLLLANRDPRRAARLRVALRPEVKGIAEISRRDGERGRTELPDDIAENAFEVRLAPGDGRLFRLVKREREWPAPRRGVGISVGG